MHFCSKRYIKGVPFLPKWYVKGVKGWTLGRSLPVLNFVKYPGPGRTADCGRGGGGGAQNADRGQNEEDKMKTADQG